MDFVLIFLLIMLFCGIVVSVLNARNKSSMKSLLDESPRQPNVVFEEAAKAKAAYERIESKLTEIDSALVALRIDKENGRISDADYSAEASTLNVRKNNLHDTKHERLKKWMELSNEASVAVMNGDFPAERQEPQFVSTDKYLSGSGSSGIAFDKLNRKFAFLTPHRKEIVSYEQIVSSEVCIDSESIIQTDRVGQVGGAALGGFLAGGVGALVMALGAQKKQIEKIRRVELKVLLSGTEKHCEIVRFFGLGEGSSARSAIEEASKWHDLISVAIREAENASKAAPVLKTGFVSASLADEIQKLAELKSQGVISGAEFEKAKASII